MHSAHRTFFFEQFSRSSLGISKCRCPVPRPTLFCNFEAHLVQVNRAKKAIAVAEQHAVRLASADASDVARAVTAARVALSEVMTIRSMSTDLKATAGLLLADALEAQCPLLPPAKARLAAEEVCAALKNHLPPWLRYPTSPLKGVVRSNEEARAMLRSARALGLLQRQSEAVELARNLRRSTLPLPPYRWRVTISQVELERWQAQARELLRELKSPAPAPPGPAPRVAESPLAMTVIDDAFPDLVQRWSWRSAGSQSAPGDKDASFSHQVLVVERLACSIFWLRGSLLVWDYASSTVLTWVDGVEEETTWDVIDVPIGAFFTQTLALVVSTDRLPAGTLNHQALS